MKNRNNVFTATLVALAFAFAPVLEAGPRLDGGRPRRNAPRFSRWKGANCCREAVRPFASGFYSAQVSKPAV